MGLIKEFREFALKGNVIDLAVGVIIGGAFGAITNSLIKDMIMPVVGMAGNVDFSNMYVGLNDKVRAASAAGGLSLDDARKVGPVLAYGSFITTVINFVILAFCIFMMIKMMNALRRRFEKQQEALPVAPPEPTKTELLLTEIRDSLRSKS